MAIAALDVPGVDTDATPTSIRLASGLLFDLAAPDPAKILLGDIADSLARQERFTGHCPLHPTVAQHSVAVEHIGRQLVPDEWTYEPGEMRMFSRALLMHDAVVAYVSDLSSPMKRTLRTPCFVCAAARTSGSEFDQVERSIASQIAEVFGYADLSPEWAGLVHQADVLAYEYESAWGGWGSAVPPSWVLANPYVLRCYRPLIVDDMHDGGMTPFLTRACSLGMS